MNQADLSPFERGAEWVRTDFHLHTVKDPGQSRRFHAEFAGRENTFCKEWIAKLKDAGIRVAVITNHNSFDRDEYRELRRLGAREGILVLPGVELGIKEGGGGIHTLVVFNPEGWVSNQQSDDRINRFLASQFSANPTKEVEPVTIYADAWRNWMATGTTTFSFSPMSKPTTDSCRSWTERIWPMSFSDAENDGVNACSACKR